MTSSTSWRRAVARCCLVASVLLASCSPSDPPRSTAELGRVIAPLPDDLVAYRRFEGRAECNWRRPGAARFTGDTMSALAALGIPEALRGRLWRRIVAHESDDIVDATSAQIVAARSHTLYAPGIAMTFGDDIVCFDTRAAFFGVQSGRLYIEGGYHVWVPDVCGNVSRLLPWWEATKFARSSRLDVLPRRDVARLAQPYGAMPEAGGAAMPIPEPPTWALLLAGALLMLCIRRRLNPKRPSDTVV